jgi:hypothetical protein
MSRQPRTNSVLQQQQARHEQTKDNRNPFLSAHSRHGLFLVLAHVLMKLTR